MHVKRSFWMLLVAAISLLVFAGGTAFSGKMQIAGKSPDLFGTLEVMAAETRTTTANLNMRTGPGTDYTVILTIPKGTSVTVEGYSGTWAKVTYAGNTGYASSTYLTASSPGTPGGTIQSTAANLNMRTGPGTSYAIILTIPKGAQVEVLSAAEGWAKVNYGGKTGYVSTGYLTGSTPGTPDVTIRYTTASLNMRTGPGTGYAIILTIPRGSQVGVMSSAGGWAGVTYSGRTGYVSETYLTGTPPGTPGTPTGSAAVAVRSGLVPYAGKRIALTFDDGGTSAQILSILNTLDQYGVKSTFFPNGTWIRSNPGLAREIASRGHRIENHSLSHPDLTDASDAEVRRQIREAKEIIRSTVGTTSTLLRPPYGSYDSRVLRLAGAEGMRYAVLWTVDTSDWATTRYGITITPDYIVNHTMQNATNNGIVLMHMSSNKTVQALPRVIQGLRDRGYTFATVNEMLP